MYQVGGEAHEQEDLAEHDQHRGDPHLAGLAGVVDLRWGQMMSGEGERMRMRRRTRRRMTMMRK